MGILTASIAAKAKTALTYCCVGAISIGANQVYEKRVKPKAKAKVHKVVQRRPVEPVALVCPPAVFPPIVGAGEKIDLRSANSLPMGLATGFVPAAYRYDVDDTPQLATSTPTEVPEPAMVGIFGLGVAGLAALRRRRLRWAPRSTGEN